MMDLPFLEPGTPAPAFSLPDLNGALHRLEDYRGRMVILNFWTSECPWVERVDGELSGWLPALAEKAAWLTLAANPTEPVEAVRRAAEARRLPLLLLDSRQQAADSYGARTTPHLFLIDTEGLLRYQGAYDDVTFRQRTPTRGYLKGAVEALLSGRLPDPARSDPYGCAIVRGFTP